MMRILLTAACILWALVLPALASGDIGPENRREAHVEIWVPPDFRTSRDKFPVIVYSHDFNGCYNDHQSLMAILAERGYIVLAPEHSDARCNHTGSGSTALRGGIKSWKQKSYANPEGWDSDTESSRRDDIVFAISSTLADPQFEPVFDKDAVGLIGAGLGGYAVLGLAGGWPEWRDPQIKAVVALSPYTAPFTQKHNRPGIMAPVMIQSFAAKHGTSERAYNRELYQRLRKPKYLIEYDPLIRSAPYNNTVAGTTVFFMGRYLKGERGALKIEKVPIRTFLMQE